MENMPHINHSETDRVCLFCLLTAILISCATLTTLAAATYRRIMAIAGKSNSPIDTFLSGVQLVGKLAAAGMDEPHPKALRIKEGTTGEKVLLDQSDNANLERSKALSTEQNATTSNKTN